jgi:hypothetical protein
LNLRTLNQLGTRLQTFSNGLVLVLLMTFVSHVYGQGDSLSLLKKDTSAITFKRPSVELLDEVMNDRDYRYEDDPEPAQNPFSKWINWLWRKVGDFFSSKSYENFWQYALMLGALCLFIFLLYKAKVLDYIFMSNQNASQLDYVVGQENIHEINFEKALEEATSGGDYRLAVRLQYLRTLKRLSEKQIINWKPDRTNATYAEDLRTYPFCHDFVGITRYFEFAWYGDFPVDGPAYEEMKQLVDSFFSKLNQPASYV